MRALNRARAGRRRAFTMIELAVTIGLTAAMFALLLPWVLNLLVISSANLDSAAGSRAAATISGGLDADLRRAVACPATGTALVASDPDHLAVLTTNSSDGSGATTLAVWKLEGTQLSRAEVAVDVDPAGCAPTGPDPLMADSGATWTPFAGSVSVQPADTDAVVAFVEASGQRSDVVVVSLEVAGSTPTSPAVSVHSTYPLPSIYRGLT